MRRYVCFLITTLLFCYGCSTKVYVQKPGTLNGKRIAIGYIDMSRMQKGKTIQNDSICRCVAQTVGETLTPYLNQSGGTVIHIPYDQFTTPGRIYEIADSAQIDLLVTGTGLLERYGKNTDFMRTLNIQLVVVKTKEIVLSGSCSGPSLTAQGSTERIGKQILKKSK